MTRSTNPVRPTIVLRNREYEAKKKIHQAELSNLYYLRKTAKKPVQRREIEEEINMKVIDWNLKFPIDKNYYDLHGMTRDGARQFARDLVYRATVPMVFRFETGRGNHSKNGVPLIKMGLLEEFKRMHRCSVTVEEHNSGVLLVEVW